MFYLIRRKVALAFFAVFVSPVLAEINHGTERLKQVVTTIDGGGSTTNTISYNERGLQSRYDIIVNAGLGGEFTNTVVFSYDERGQISKLVSDSVTPFGNETWVYDYVYDAESGTKLQKINGSSDLGTLSEKVFEYDAKGRILGMKFSWTTKDGLTAREDHVLSYDASGRIHRNVRTLVSSLGEETGGFEITHDETVAPISYVEIEPGGGTETGTFQRSGEWVKKVGVVSYSGSETQRVETVSTFESGGCLVPDVSDGFIVETVFNGPDGLYFPDICR